MRHRSRALALSLAVGTLVGCDTSPSTSELCLAPRFLAYNKVLTNRMFTNGLPEAALRGEVTTVADPEALDDPFVRTVFEYTVSCALGPDQSVEVERHGETLVFEGALGLAPEWGDPDGSCDGACRGWVSACLIARTNAKGIAMPISLRGDHPSLAPTDDEVDAYTIHEAVYYGDLFADSPRLFACLPDGHTEIPRVCGSDHESCGVTIVGACSDHCDATGCRDPAGNAYPEMIAVYRDPDASTCTPRALGHPNGNYN
jgi:hypothetical protein